MTDLQKEYMQKIKRGKVGVRILKNSVNYPFKYQTEMAIYNDHLNIIEIPEKTPQAISFPTSVEKDTEKKTTVFVGNSDLVKKMAKLLDELIEAIELEDYQTFKSIKDAIDKM